MLVPVLIGIIIDRAIEPRSASLLVGWIGALALLFAVLTTVYRLGARQLMLAIATESHVLRAEVASKILDKRGIRSPLRSGDLLSISTTDADNTSYLLDYVPRIVGAVVATIFCSEVLLAIDLPLGLVVVLGTPIAVALLQFSAPAITKRVTAQQEMAGTSTSVATDLISGIRVLRGIGAEDAAADRYRIVSRQALHASLRAAKIQGLFNGVSSAVSALLAAAVAVTAGFFALEGRISIGELITVIGLSQFLIEPLGLLAIVASWVAEARASADRVALIMDAPVRVDQASTASSALDGHSLRIESLSLGSLADFDLAVDEGDTVGIVAHPTDAGALLRVLSSDASAVDYTGTVTLAGQLMDSLDLDVRRRTILVEPHNTDLFAGSIASNILSRSSGDGRPEIDKQLLDEVLTASCTRDVVSSDRAGIERVVTDRGASLSGGQRQRVALARALVTRPPILVLHDPTTAVDSVTEHAVAEGILRFRRTFGSTSVGGPPTTIIITSSPALLAVTDRVIFLGDGRISAEGSHHELSADDASYREFVLR